MDRTVTTTIDPELCTGCGACVRVCPSETITLEGDRAAVTGDRSLNCGHCEAVCPSGAARVASIEPGALRFRTFQLDERWLAPGEFDIAALVRLMASRRSCRNYQDRPVPRDVIDDLIHIGITAPSGTNSQRWTFTVLPDAAAVASLGERIARFFGRLNRMAEMAWLRRGLRWVGRPELDAYFRDNYESVARALAEHRAGGRDRLFHGAPVAIVVGSRPGASCPAEDALLATQNMLLGAHAMGLGTCLVGYAVAAMARDPGIKRLVGIPTDERVYAVIALGYPDEAYERQAGRREPLVRYHGG